jgi:hypothetical protein
MSLILYYRDCFTADCKINNSIDGSVDLFMKRSKTYFSEDKRFAAMACGLVPSNRTWEEIRTIFDLYKIGLEKTPDEIKKQTEKRLDKIFEAKWTSSSLICVFGNYFIHYVYSPEFESGLLEHMDSQFPFAAGTGLYAAKVLIDSGRQLNQDEFFRIVSLADKNVSTEFTFIELKDVIDTPWYKK